ncbi:MAG TPA: hypothetical protein PL045_12635 [Chitinophagaceae bacterium]|nr:hypothetical protein [Chitinophagaceae bacterium]
MFCKGFSTRIKKVLNDMNDKIEHYAHIALSITSIAKGVLNSSSVQSIAQLIGSWGTEESEKINSALDAALKELNVLADTNDLSDKVNLIIQQVIGKNEFEKNAFLIKLASRIIANLDGNSKKEHFYDTVAQGASLQ